MKYRYSHAQIIWLTGAGLALLFIGVGLALEFWHLAANILGALGALMALFGGSVLIFIAMLLNSRIPQEIYHHEMRNWSHEERLHLFTMLLADSMVCSGTGLTLVRWGQYAEEITRTMLWVGVLGIIISVMMLMLVILSDPK